MCDQENSTDDADDAEDSYEIFFLSPAAHCYDMAAKVREANEALLSDDTFPATQIQSRKVTFREGKLASYADEVSTDDMSDVTSISDDEELCWGQADPVVPLQTHIVDGNNANEEPTETHHSLLESWSPFVQNEPEVYVTELTTDRLNSTRRVRPKSAYKSTYVRPNSADDTDYDEDEDTDDEGVQTILSEDVDDEDEVDEILSDIQDNSTLMDSSEVFDTVARPSSPQLRTLQLSPSPSPTSLSPPRSPPKTDDPLPVPHNLTEIPTVAESKPAPPPVTKKGKLNNSGTKRVQTAPIQKAIPQNSQSSQRNCCNSARRPRLPAYNGLHSEYGLSAEQLQERERIGEARRLARRLRQQEHKAEQDARRRLSESLFKEWLRRKSESDIGVCIQKNLHVNRDRLPCKRLAAAQERNRQKVSGPSKTGSSSSVEASLSNPSTEGSSRGRTPGLVGIRYTSKGHRPRTAWKQVSDPHAVAVEDLIRSAPPRLLAACRIYLGLTVR